MAKSIKKNRKKCAGYCGGEFLAKPGERTCKRCKVFTRRTGAQYRRLETPKFGIESYRSRASGTIFRSPPQPCRYCGVPLTEKNFSLDHATPKERGGADELINVDHCCCKDCNTAKGPLTMPEFLGVMAAIQTAPAESRKRFMAALRTGSKLRFGAVRRRNA